MQQLIKHFRKTIRGQDGRIADDTLAQKKGFICAVLPLQSNIQPGDLLMGGLALKREEDALHLYSYLLREICANGSVIPMTTRKSSYSEGDLGTFELDVDMAIQALKDHDLADKASRMYRAMFKEAGSRYMSLVAHMVHMITGQPDSGMNIRLRALSERRRSVHRQQSHGRPYLTRSDAVNAVTELARDTKDPDHRWALMRLGGELLMREFEHKTPPAQRSPRQKRGPLVRETSS